ncbi:CRIB domain-containing protein RIC1 [Linum grandiflorum]
MTQSSSSSSKVVERCVFLPFSIIGGCNSHSTIQVAGDKNASDHDEQRRHRLPAKSKPRRRATKEEDEAAGRERRGYWSAAAWCGRENKRRRRNKNKKGGQPADDDKKSNDGGGGVNKLVTTIKTSFSQLFVYKQSRDEEEEEEEKEMEIGFPTDVKHVTHIGLDGTTTATNHNPNKALDADADPDPQLDDWMSPAVSFPTISLKQLELAMTAQLHAHNFN